MIWFFRIGKFVLSDVRKSLSIPNNKVRMSSIVWFFHIGKFVSSDFYHPLSIVVFVGPPFSSSAQPTREEKLDPNSCILTGTESAAKLSLVSWDARREPRRRRPAPVLPEPLNILLRAVLQAEHPDNMPVDVAAAVSLVTKIVLGAVDVAGLELRVYPRRHAKRLVGPNEQVQRPVLRPPVSFQSLSTTISRPPGAATRYLRWHDRSPPASSSLGVTTALVNTPV
jgi:hypothetical protein